MDDHDQVPEPPNHPVSTSPPWEREDTALPPPQTTPDLTRDDSGVAGVPVPVPLPHYDQAGQASSQPAVKKRKRLPFVAMGIALAVVLLAGGTAFAYTWYQNPDRVIMDGFSKALQATLYTYTGTVNVANPTDDSFPVVKLELTGAVANGNSELDVKAIIDQDSQKYDIHGKGMFARDGTLYVRFQDLDKTFDAYFSDNPDMQLPEESKPLIDQMIAKLDGQWIKISPSDLEEYSPEAKNVMTCLRQAADTFSANGTAREEVALLYQKYPFIRVKDNLGMKGDSVGYAIAPDDAQQKAFWTGMKDTRLYKDLQDCDDSFKFDEQDLENDSVKSEHTEIWLHQWTHEITSMKMRSEDKDGTVVDMSLLPRFGGDVSVETPRDAKTLSEMQEDIQAIFMEYITSQAESEPLVPASLGQTL